MSKFCCLLSWSSSFSYFFLWFFWMLFCFQKKKIFLFLILQTTKFNQYTHNDTKTNPYTLCYIPNKFSCFIFRLDFFSTKKIMNAYSYYVAIAWKCTMRMMSEVCVYFIYSILIEKNRLFSFKYSIFFTLSPPPLSSSFHWPYWLVGLLNKLID